MLFKSHKGICKKNKKVSGIKQVGYLYEPVFSLLNADPDRVRNFKCDRVKVKVERKNKRIYSRTIETLYLKPYEIVRDYFNNYNSETIKINTELSGESFTLFIYDRGNYSAENGENACYCIIESLRIN